MLRMSGSAPVFILSDKGSNISGELISSLCNTFEIEKRRSSAYYSQGNGFAERSIGAWRWGVGGSKLEISV